MKARGREPNHHFRINADGTGLVALTWNTLFYGHMRWY